MRYLSKPRVSERSHETRADVVSFLSNLYISTAETLPDVRDDPLSTAEELKLQAPGAETDEDPYAKTLVDMVAGQETSQQENLSGKPEKKRSKKRGVEINPLRANMEKKCLPPGCMRDHWEQYRLLSHLENPASFPTFWRVPRTSTRKVGQLFGMFWSRVMASHVSMGPASQPINLLLRCG